MANLTLYLNMDNAAFEPNIDGWECRNHETARILRVLAQKIERDGVQEWGKLLDINGNRAGDYTANLD